MNNETILFEGTVRRTTHEYKESKDVKLKIVLLHQEKHDILKIFKDGEEISLSFAFGCPDLWLPRMISCVWDSEYGHGRTTTEISGYTADEYEKLKKLKNTLQEVLE